MSGKSENSGNPKNGSHSTGKVGGDGKSEKVYEIPVKIINRKQKEEPMKIPIEPDSKTTEESCEKDKASGENKVAESASEKGIADMTEVEKLHKEIAARDERINELEEQVKRLSAEFANFRLRQEKKLEEIRKYAAEDVILEFFPILDSFEQAQSAVKKSGDLETLTKGMEMIENKIKEILKNLGVEEIKAKGEKFDPAFHFAVSVEESDEFPDETVLEEYRTGYEYRGKVLRPTMVKVSRTRGKPENG